MSDSRQSVYLELSTARRMGNATRRVEQHGVDITRAQSGHRVANNVSYYGMFAVINTSDETTQQIKIVDGLDYDAEYCGYVQVNNLTTQDIPSAELEITADAYIYRQSVAVFDESEPPVMISATVTFEQSSIRPEWEAETEKELLAVVKYADGKITNIIEYRLTERVNIKGAC